MSTSISSISSVSSANLAPTQSTPASTADPEFTIGQFEKGSSESKDKKWSFEWNQGKMGISVNIYHNGAFIPVHFAGMLYATGKADKPFDCNMYEGKPTGSVKLGLIDMGGKKLPPKAAALMKTCMAKGISMSMIIGATLRNWVNANVETLPKIEDKVELDPETGEEKRTPGQRVLHPGPIKKKTPKPEASKPNKSLVPYPSAGIKVPSKKTYSPQGAAINQLEEPITCTILFNGKKVPPPMTRKELNDKLSGQRWFVTGKAEFSAFINAAHTMYLTAQARLVDFTFRPGTGERTEEETKADEEEHMATMSDLGFEALEEGIASMSISPAPVSPAASATSASLPPQPVQTLDSASALGLPSNLAVV